MQNRTAMQWQQKIRKERKISQSNVILEESTEKFESIQWHKKEDKHHPGSTIVHLRYMAKNLMESGDLLSKYQIRTILLLHLRRIQSIDIWMRPNLNQS